MKNYLQIGLPDIGGIEQSQFELVKAIRLVTGGPNRHCKKRNGAMLVTTPNLKKNRERERETADWEKMIRLPSMLLKEQNGVSMWRKERPFLRQASSTEGVERTITTGVISSNSICPSGVLAGSIVIIFFRISSVAHSVRCLAVQIGSLPSKDDCDLGVSKGEPTVQSPGEGTWLALLYHDVVLWGSSKG